MSRWVDREEKPEGAGGFETLSRSGAEKRERSAPTEPEDKDFGQNLRERVLVRDREYSVRASERETLFELGRFRVINESDLVKGVYSGRAELAKADLRSLGEQHLVYVVSFHAGRSGKERILTLSSAGRDLVEKTDPRVERDGQRVYSGFVKPSEIEHDALLYRAFQKESGRLRANGSTVRRVVLDYELKQRLFSKQARERGKRPYREIQAQSARELTLPIVEGRVMLPDVRIEYEDERGVEKGVDVEVATGNYRGVHLAAKASAGFRVYAGPSFSVDQGRRLKGNVFREERSMVLSL